MKWKTLKRHVIQYTAFLFLGAAVIAVDVLVTEGSGFPDEYDLASSGSSFSIRGSLTLQPISPQEITGGGSQVALSMGTWRTGMSKLELPSITTRIVRKVPSLWRVRLRKEKAKDVAAWDVSYELVSANGRVNYLSHESHPESQIKVTIRPLSSKVVAKRKDYVEVEGGAVFYLNIGSAFIAGKYAGTLTITQNHF